MDAMNSSKTDDSTKQIYANSAPSFEFNLPVLSVSSQTYVLGRYLVVRPEGMIDITPGSDLDAEFASWEAATEEDLFNFNQEMDL